VLLLWTGKTRNDFFFFVSSALNKKGALQTSNFLLLFPTFYVIKAKKPLLSRRVEAFYRRKE
jgi:hypothetical protein